MELQFVALKGYSIHFISHEEHDVTPWSYDDIAFFYQKACTTKSV